MHRIGLDPARNAQLRILRFKSHASFRVAAYRPITSADILIKWADDALYQAKAAAKNCVKKSIA